MRTVLAFLFASIACCAQSGHLKSFAEYSFVEKGEVFQALVRANPGDWIEVSSKGVFEGA
jgi:hypothetical protein